jgi:polyisoprenoid-binding protein YceI
VSSQVIHSLGPANGTLSVRTGRTGAVAKVGHDLLLEVTAWEATLELADDASRSRLQLSADSSSLRVREGTGGMTELGDDDRANIEQTIGEEVLHGRDIAFGSTAASREGDRLRFEGQLTIDGTARPLSFELTVDQAGAVSGSAKLRQTEWGIKPYSTLFGALKVADEVEVRFEGSLDQSR